VLTKFWDKIAENLAQETIVILYAPAFAFWTGGLGIYALRNGWQSILDMLEKLNTIQSIAILLVAIAILTISTILMGQFTVPILRWLEGYWQGPFAGLAQNRIDSINEKLSKKEERWNWLAKQRNSEELNPAQAKEYARLDAELANYPVNETWRMPTRLGNLIRMAEEFPANHYGLEINITWPRLWLVLPEAVQKEVARSRQNVDRSVQIFTWAVLFVFWGFLSPWAMIIALILAIAFYRSILQTAGAYGEILKSSYDLFRFKLYDAAYWPKPESPATEIHSGQALTNYLHRAEASKKIKFDFRSNEDKSQNPRAQL